ncbi:MAG: HDOD domain-containing protein [Gammaproteobacteria bacterium]|nr:HDOD domain-containing protein [Gammaproteobacteria bacterium]
MIESIKPTDLPSPPQTALNVLQACSDDSVDFSVISAIVTNDPQLTAEVLRMVNSAFYARSDAISSLNRAISVIGVKSLRNLCLCLSVKEVFSATDFDAGFLNDFWTDSIFRAVAARHLAELSGKDADECFTAGLLQDFGLLVLIFLYPDKAGSWYSLRQLDPEFRLTKELSVFKQSHIDVFKMIGQQWSLPPSIVMPVSEHHQCQQGDNAGVCQILNAADWFAYVITSDNVKEASAACKQQMAASMSLSAEKVDACLSAISSSVNQAADALGIDISQVTEYDELLKKSNIRLAEDNLSIQELNWQLQETISERDKLAAALQQEIELATEIQESLLPDNENLPVYAFNLAARQLSGDFYDYQQCSDGSILFCLADVSGKGVNASLLMVKVSSLFHCLGKYIGDLEKLVKMINIELVETSIRGMFVTFVCGKYNPANGKLEVINAGHLPALIISGENTLRVSSSSIPLGIEKKVDFKSECYILKQACLYLYSDGITESVIDGQELGLDGFVGLLKKMSSVSAADQLKQLKEKFASASTRSHDDMTLLIVEGN